MSKNVCIDEACYFLWVEFLVGTCRFLEKGLLYSGQWHLPPVRILMDNSGWQGKLKKTVETCLEYHRVWSTAQ